jgi:hypothetical protein
MKTSVLDTASIIESSKAGGMFFVTGVRRIIAPLVQNILKWSLQLPVVGSVRVFVWIAGHFAFGDGAFCWLLCSASIIHIAELRPVLADESGGVSFYSNPSC